MNLYIFSLILTVLISVTCAFLTFKRRKIEGARSLFFLMISVTIFAFCYIFEILSKDLAVKLFWYKSEYIGIATIPFFWLLFSLEYTYVSQKIINKLVWFIALPSITTILLVWTNDFHYFFISNISVADNPLVPVITKINEGGYWMHIAFSYLFIIIGVAILIRTLSMLNWFFLRQGLLLALGAMLPLIGSVFNAFNINPFYPFDITPSVCAVSGFLLLWCLVNLKTFQILPIARDLFFNNINTGILVMDDDFKIIDMNRTVQHIIKADLKSVIGTGIDKAIKDNDLKQFLKNNEKVIFEDISIIINNSTFYYSVNKIPIYSKDFKKRGFLVEFKNITERKIIEKELIQSKGKLSEISDVLYKINISENERRVLRLTVSTIKTIFKLNMFGFIYLNGKHEKRISSNMQILRSIKEEYMEKKEIVKILNNGEVLFYDLDEDKYGINKDFPELLNISKLMIVPIPGFGSAVFFLERNNMLGQEDIELCKLLIGYSLEAIKRIELQKTLKDQSEKDSLTGSYNRRYFDKIIDKEVERAKRYNHVIYFLMIDINRFKEINDRYGHQTGDRILKDVYEVMAGQVRKIDTIIRYGGDEFLIIVPGISRENIISLIKRINDSVRDWSDKNKLIDFEISLSIGTGFYESGSDESVEKILYYADMDMYKNKEKFKNK